MVLQQYKTKLVFLVFLTFSFGLWPFSHGSCPLNGLGDTLSQRFQGILFTKGQDEETTRRNRPEKKNLFGVCQTEPCSRKLLYRTFIGICNNIDSDLKYGRRTTVLKRLLEPTYDDGVGRPRSRSLKDRSNFLPNPRKVSNKIHGSLQSPKDQHHTLVLMQWGQFLDHDITLTPMFRERNGSLVDCTACDSNPRTCHPIHIPEDDPYFPAQDPITLRPKCLEFVRSQSVTFHWKEQLNSVTSWIDSSHIYGSFKCHADHLRLFKNGKLKWLPHPLSPKALKALLPRHATNHECTSHSELCFNAGDDRANEQPGLTLMHTIFMRAHNQIAEQLSYLNPAWNDETIFQETRKILIAINQQITYKEFLPRILGKSLMKLYGLELEHHPGEFFDNYDNQCDPGILNEFATAAFRFGHSLIPEGYRLDPKSLTKTFMNSTSDDHMMRLRSHINNPDVIMSPLVTEDLARSLIFEAMPSYDRGIANEVRNHLMEHSGIEYSGVDLAALNIQRGRDHGLPGYTQYEHFCSKDILKRQGRQSRSRPPIQNFDDLRFKFDKTLIGKFREVYSHVEDIDLFSGGISEKSISDGLVGTTFGCIIALQFEKLRKCDRFWYETPDKRLGFSGLQLKNIRQINLATLICQNIDSNDLELPLNIFDLPDPVNNPSIPCSQHPQINLKNWATSNHTVPNFCNYEGTMIKPGEYSRISACTSCFCPYGNQGKAVCKSTRIRSCQDLVDEVGPEAVISDKTCQEACGHLLNNTISCS